MINLILDILIYNNTSFKSIFFLNNINNKPYLYNIIISLFIDIFISNSYILVTIYVSLIYLLHKYIKLNYNMFIYYYLFNISITLIYYILFNIFNYINILDILNVFIINSIFICITFRKYKIDKSSIL